MKIKVAFLDNDVDYLESIMSVFNAKYADRMEVYSFTDGEVALQTVLNEDIDVFVTSYKVAADVKELSAYCNVAYFVESKDIDRFNNLPAINKYQKVELIYKEILKVFSEGKGDVSLTGERMCKVTCFASPCGGTGSSVMSVVMARQYAKKGKKVLYLNLEVFGTADAYFNGAGSYDMSDIVFALKSKKGNLGVKVESYVKQDSSGVFFLSGVKLVPDILEIDDNELVRFIDEVRLLGIYDYIIIDMDLDRRLFVLMEHINNIVLVTDGTDISDTKTKRFLDTLCVMEKNGDIKIKDKLSVVYNKMNIDIRGLKEPGEYRILGIAPRVDSTSIKQVVNDIARTGIFGDMRNMG